MLPTRSQAHSEGRGIFCVMRCFSPFPSKRPTNALLVGCGMGERAGDRGSGVYSGQGRPCPYVYVFCRDNDMQACSALSAVSIRFRAGFLNIQTVSKAATHGAGFSSRPDSDAFSEIGASSVLRSGLRFRRRRRHPGGFRDRLRSRARHGDPPRVPYRHNRDWSRR